MSNSVRSHTDDKAELTIAGDFKQEDLERLKKQINRLVENLQDAFLD